MSEIRQIPRGLDVLAQGRDCLSAEEKLAGLRAVIHASNNDLRSWNAPLSRLVCQRTVVAKGGRVRDVFEVRKFDARYYVPDLHHGIRGYLPPGSGSNLVQVHQGLAPIDCPHQRALRLLVRIGLISGITSRKLIRQREKAIERAAW